MISNLVENAIKYNDKKEGIVEVSCEEQGEIIQEVQPDEIYNLGAMSHVKVSFEMPEYTADAVGVGALRILEAIRILGLEQKTKKQSIGCEKTRKQPMNASANTGVLTLMLKDKE